LGKIPPKAHYYLKFINLQQVKMIGIGSFGGNAKEESCASLNGERYLKLSKKAGFLVITVS
jgi:hypothetical protein